MSLGSKAGCHDLGGLFGSACVVFDEKHVRTGGLQIDPTQASFSLTNKKENAPTLNRPSNLLHNQLRQNHISLRGVCLTHLKQVNDKCYLYQLTSAVQTRLYVSPAIL